MRWFWRKRRKEAADAARLRQELETLKPEIERRSRRMKEMADRNGFAEWFADALNPPRKGANGAH